MNINVQKILFSFLFSLSILFICLNIPFFQEKLFIKYLFNKQHTKNVNVVFEDFDYKIFNNTVKSNLYLIQKNSEIKNDTILFLPELNLEFRFLDLFFSKGVNIDKFTIRSPIIFASNQRTYNHSLYENVISYSKLLTNKVSVKKLSIQNLSIKIDTVDFIDSVNIVLNNINLNKNYLDIKKSTLFIDSAYVDFDCLLQNEQFSFNVHRCNFPMSSSVLKNKYITDSLDLDLSLSMHINKDSLITDSKIKFGSSEMNLSFFNSKEESILTFNNSFFCSKDLAVNIPQIEHLDTFRFAFNVFNTPSTQDSSAHGYLETDYGLIDFHLDNYRSWNGINLNVANFELGNLLNIPSIGDVSGKMNLNAFRDTIQEKNNFTLLIDSLDYNDYVYNNIEIESFFLSNYFDCSINIDDQNLQSEFSLKFKKTSQDSVYRGFVNGSVDYVDLIDLNVPFNQSLDYISTNFEITNVNLLNTKNNNQRQIDLFNSFINLTDLNYVVDNNIKTIDNISLNLSNSSKIWTFESSIGSIKTDFFSSFNLSEDYNYIFNSLHSNFKYHSPFEFSADLSDATFFSDIFLNNVSFSDSINLNFSLDSERHFSCYIKIPFLKFNNVELINVNFSNQNIESQIFNSSISNVVFKEEYSLNDMSLLTEYVGHGMYRYVLSNNDLDNLISSSIIQGNIEFTKNGFYINFNDSSTVSIYNNVWSIDNKSKIIYADHQIDLDQLKISCNKEIININGSICDKTKLHFNFEDVKLSKLHSFKSNKSLRFDGYVKGDFFYDKLSLSTLTSSISINDFYCNNVSLGQLKLNQYSSNNVLYTNGLINNENNLLNFETEYDMFQQTILGDFLFHQFPIDVLNTLINPVDSLNGIVSGSVNVNGPISDYKMNGQLLTEKVNFNIPYLKTRYSILKEKSLIKFDGSKILLDSLLLFDTYYKTFANFNGLINHKSLKEISYKFNISSDELFVLNTNKYHNNSYYGTAFLKGITSIVGDSDKVILNIDGKLLPRSKLMLPLSKSKEIQENSFVYFKKNNNQIDLDKLSTSNSKFNMNFNIEIEDDSEIQLIFDEELGDVIKGYGQGDLFLKINDSGNFEIFGDFIIDNGHYLFTLQDVITKSFNIEKGGIISFNGNPYNALIDLNLLYNVQASLNTLNPNYDRTIKSPVICKMQMSNKLLSPNIDFDIAIPNSDQIVETSLETMTNTEQKLLEQFLYLLIANSFLVKNDSNIDYISNTLATTGTELLSNQLSNWLSQTTDAFDLGFKWIPGTGDSLSYQQVELAVSKKFLDDRFIINGNVGTPPEQSQTNIVGDLDIEYNVFRDGRLKLRFFNRAKDYDPLTESLGYEQGLGIFFKKRFNRFSEIFQNQNK